MLEPLVLVMLEPDEPFIFCFSIERIIVSDSELELVVEDKTLDRIKNHVNRHKLAYSVGVVVVIAGVSYYIGTRMNSSRTLSPSILGINNKLDQSVVILADRSGPPSWRIYWVEANKEFNSQRELALLTGLSETHISKLLNGKRNPIDGFTLVRRGLAG